MPKSLIAFLSFFVNRNPRFLFLGAGIVFMLVFLDISLAKLAVQRHSAAVELKQIQEKTMQLREENAKLRDLLQQAAGSSFLEKEARKKLNLKKPGEKAVIILPENQAENQELRIRNQEDKMALWSLWQKIKRFLFP